MTDATTTPLSLRARAGVWIESKRVQSIIIGVIVLNAIILGLETSPTITGAIGELLTVLDRICLAIFVVELAIKLWAHGWRFFTDGWNVFDLLVVVIALVPAAGPLAVLRGLRILRVLRLVSAIPQLRFIVTTLISALPGIASIGALLGLIFYVFAVMATSLFGHSFPDWFGSVGDSLYSLFQIMTLESWSMGIVRPVMEVYPWAWAFFVPFILVSSFTILNLFVAVIVDTMQTLQADKVKAEETRVHEVDGAGDAADSHAHARHVPAAVELVGGDEAASREHDRASVADELAALRSEVARLTASIGELHRDRRPEE